MKNKDENSVKQTPSAVVTREATMPEPSLSEGPVTDIHPSHEKFTIASIHRSGLWNLILDKNAI